LQGLLWIAYSLALNLCGNTSHGHLLEYIYTFFSSFEPLEKYSQILGFSFRAPLPRGAWGSGRTRLKKWNWAKLTPPWGLPQKNLKSSTNSKNPQMGEKTSGKAKKTKNLLNPHIFFYHGGGAPPGEKREPAF